MGIMKYHSRLIWQPLSAQVWPGKGNSHKHHISEWYTGWDCTHSWERAPLTALLCTRALFLWINLQSFPQTLTLSPLSLTHNPATQHWWQRWYCLRVWVTSLFGGVGSSPTAATSVTISNLGDRLWFVEKWVGVGSQALYSRKYTSQIVRERGGPC